MKNYVDSAIAIFENSLNYPIMPAISSEMQYNQRRVSGRDGHSDRNSSDDTLSNMEASEPRSSFADEEEDTNLDPLVLDKDRAEDWSVAESMVCTGAVAIGPMGDGFKQTKKRKKKKTLKEDHAMGRVIKEYTPDFDGAKYNPGSPKMHKHGGKGVTGNRPTSGEYGHPTELTDEGEPLGRKHKETAAMCDVDENGVENKPQGVHVSKHAEADDKITKKLGKNWPDKPTNHGAAVEKMKGSRYQDSGVLEWSMANISQSLSEDSSIEDLFDMYVESSDHVNLQDFNKICEAHGYNSGVDSASFKQYISDNSNYVFQESDDDSYYKIDDMRGDEEMVDEYEPEGEEMDDDILPSVDDEDVEDEELDDDTDDLGSDEEEDEDWEDEEFEDELDDEDDFEDEFDDEDDEDDWDDEDEFDDEDDEWEDDEEELGDEESHLHSAGLDDYDM